MNKMDFRVVFGCSRCRMNMGPTKVSAVVKGILDGQICEILVSEDNHLTFGHKSSELVFPALLNLLSCTPVTSGPIVGVRSLVVTPLASSSG